MKPEDTNTAGMPPVEPTVRPLPFDEWLEANRRRMHCGHFDEDQCMYAAWAGAIEHAAAERELLRTTLVLAYGALSMSNPCAADCCKAEQQEWKDDAMQAIDRVLRPNTEAQRAAEGGPTGAPS
jgi:hypothetical protein